VNAAALAPSLRERHAHLLAALDDELRACGRAPDAVTILAVAKRQPLERVREALAAGIAHVGESYYQEAVRKYGLEREALAAARLHFIGRVQTNKAAGIARLFDVVQSVDRPEAALALDRAARRIGKRLVVLLQLNLAAPGRQGCDPSEAERLAEVVHACPGLHLDGVMAMGPLTDDRRAIARAFERAAAVFARIGGTTLSLGMSGDWREAVRAGATMIRIGTALFGSRGVAAAGTAPDSSEPSS